MRAKRLIAGIMITGALGAGVGVPVIAAASPVAMNVHNGHVHGALADGTSPDMNVHNG